MISRVGLFYEVLEHQLRHIEVCYDAVLHGLDGHDVARGATQHVLCLSSNGQGLLGGPVDGHDGWFVDHDAAAFGVNERVRRP